MKSSSARYAFNYPWELCCEAYQRRFPTHPRVPILLKSCLLSDEYDESTQIRTLARRCIVDVEAPGWVKRSLGIESFEFCQITRIDSHAQIMAIESRNETLKGKPRIARSSTHASDAGLLPIDKFDILETLSMRASKSNAGWTEYELKASLELPQFPLSGLLQKYIMKSYAKNTQKNKSIDLAFIHDVLQEGGHWAQYRHPSRSKEKMLVESPSTAMVSLKAAKGRPSSGKKGQAGETDNKNDGKHAMAVQGKPQPSPELKAIGIFLAFFWIIAILLLPTLLFSIIPVGLLQGYLIGILLMASFLLLDHLPYAQLLAKLSEEMELRELVGSASQQTGQVVLTIGLAILVALPQLIARRLVHFLAANVGWTSSITCMIGSLVALIFISAHALLFQEQPCRLASGADGLEDLPDEEEELVSDTSLLSDASKLSFSEDTTQTTEPQPLHKRRCLEPTSTTNTDIEESFSEPEVEPEAEEGNKDLESLSRLLVKNKTLHQSLHSSLASLPSLESLALSVPCVIHRLVKGKYHIHYLIQLTWKSPGSATMKASTERTFEECHFFAKHLTRLKHIHVPPSHGHAQQELSSHGEPGLSASLGQSIHFSSLGKISVPRKEGTTAAEKEAYAASLEYRRVELEQYLRETLSLLHSSKLPKIESLLIDFLSYESLPREELDAWNEPSSIVHMAAGSSSATNKSSATFVRPSLVGWTSLALWRSCWKDYKFILNADRLVFYSPHSASKELLEHSIDLSKLKSVQRVEDRANSESPALHSTTREAEGVPFSDSHFIKLELQGTGLRGEFYLACKRKESFDRMLEYFKKHLPVAQSRYSQQPLLLAGQLPCLLGEQVSFKKMILNKRKIHFASVMSSRASSLARSLLVSILDIYTDYNRSGQTLDVMLTQRLLEFRDTASQLQAISLAELSEQEKFAFYVNIYHTLLIHATLELGCPSPTFPMRRFLYAACYDLNGYLYNLADLEHSVLRAPTSRPLVVPTAMLSRWSSAERLPSKDPRRLNAPLLAGDPRVNFVLSNGTCSSIDHIYILDPQRLEEQLEHVGRHYLSEKISLKADPVSGKKTIILPVLLQWYSRDFGGTRDRRALLKQIIPRMPPSLKEELLAMGVLKEDPLPAQNSMTPCANGLLSPPLLPILTSPALSPADQPGHPNNEGGRVADEKSILHHTLNPFHKIRKMKSKSKKSKHLSLESEPWAREESSCQSSSNMTQASGKRPVSAHEQQSASMSDNVTSVIVTTLDEEPEAGDGILDDKDDSLSIDQENNKAHQEEESDAMPTVTASYIFSPLEAPARRPPKLRTPSLLSGSSQTANPLSGFHLSHHLKIKFELYDWTPQKTIKKGHNLDNGAALGACSLS